MSARLSTAERNRLFGRPGSSLVYVRTPWGLTVACHPKVANRFRLACQRAAATSTWRPRRIDGFNLRTIRGTSTPSLHSYGLAWDFFNKPFPQPVDVWGQTNAPPAGFRAAFRSQGFFLGADFSGRKDIPHIEWATAPPKSTGGGGGGGGGGGARRPVLRRGGRGSAVKVWQRAMKLPADGVFGPRTEAATVAFQHFFGLRPDGIVGPKSWAAAARLGLV